MDPTVYAIEITGDGKTLEAAHEQVGEFVMKSLQKWHRHKVRTGRTPHVHVEPRMLTRKQIDEMEVDQLIHDARTFTKG